MYEFAADLYLISGVEKGFGDFVQALNLTYFFNPL